MKNSCFLFSIIFHLNSLDNAAFSQMTKWILLVFKNLIFHCGFTCLYSVSLLSHTSLNPISLLSHTFFSLVSVSQSVIHVNERCKVVSIHSRNIVNFLLRVHVKMRVLSTKNCFSFWTVHFCLTFPKLSLEIWNVLVLGIQDQSNAGSAMQMLVC